MKNVHQLKGDSDTSTFFSFKNPQYLHILVELLLLLIIMLYVRRNVGRLQRQIDDLKAIVQKQQETLNLHEKILRGNPQPSLVTTVPWSTPSQTNMSPQHTSFQPPPLPSFETIATIFNVPLDGSSTEVNEQNEPNNSSNTTIIDTTNHGNLNDGVQNSINPIQDIEKELVNEINELNVEQQKHNLSLETPDDKQNTPDTPIETKSNDDNSSESTSADVESSNQTEVGSDSDGV
jgi:hypothetical protein